MNTIKTLFLGTVLSLLLLSGCGALLERSIQALPEKAQEAVLDGLKAWSDRQWSLQDPIDEFFAAVDARDAQAVRALFAPNVQDSDEDLDESIQALFDLYPGPTEDCQMRTPPGSSRSLGWGRRSNTVHNLVPVVCQGENYYASFAYTTRDEADGGNVGLTRVVFVTEKVQADRAFRDTLSLEDGLTVAADCPGDFETRRIGVYPYVFTPMERTVTPAELAAFLQTEDRWEDFAARFGPPNAESGASVYYELPSENGQARYALIYTHDFGDGVERVYLVYVMDGLEAQPLETIWKNETNQD